MIQDTVRSLSLHTWYQYHIMPLGTYIYLNILIGMFISDDDSRLCWFKPDPTDDHIAISEYKLVGMLLGLAVYNSVILDVHFPLALYKKLMNAKVNLQDLRQLDPVSHLKALYI